MPNSPDFILCYPLCSTGHFRNYRSRRTPNFRVMGLMKLSPLKHLFPYPLANRRNDGGCRSKSYKFRTVPCTTASDSRQRARCTPRGAVVHMTRVSHTLCARTVNGRGAQLAETGYEAKHARKTGRMWSSGGRIGAACLSGSPSRAARTGAAIAQFSSWCATANTRRGNIRRMWVARGTPNTSIGWSLKQMPAILDYSAPGVVQGERTSWTATRLYFACNTQMLS